MKNYKTWANMWTETAKECYERGCNCRGCLIQEQMETRCDMKRAVFELVKKFGKPPKELNTNLSKSMLEVVELIIEGCNSIEDIAKKLHKKNRAVSTLVYHLYCLARDNYNLKFKRIPKEMWFEFVDWVRQGGFNERI